MQLNPKTVKTLRLQHSWTQQHLADVSDVSLRTIQRVEKEGTASKETTMSLCAVFEVRQGELIKLDEAKAIDSQQPDKTIKFTVVIAATAFISFAFGVASVLFFVK
jgi:transcriptional regulator with XRE-family HTH domain